MRPVKTISIKNILLTAVIFAISFSVKAQMLTGVWHGKINGAKTEVKMIRSGDSITGTSYYYASPKSYRRYTIKGYFDATTNEVIWWDDRLVEEKAGGIFTAPGKMPLLSRADFNCPGGSEMYLDGSSNEKNEEIKDGEVHLQKITGKPQFTDEWDWVIENFTVGTNDPFIIDSIGQLAFLPPPVSTKAEPLVLNKKPGMVSIPQVAPPAATQPSPPIPAVIAPKTIEEKFITRSKKVFTTLPAAGDSILLSFYDNAIVDGDSISLFLDGQLLFSHIKLAGKPYTISLVVNQLKTESELVMVAENLGAIPPNTSYMVAIIDNKRYAANLASTENSSAVIRLVKPK